MSAGKKILVVDDEETIRQTTARLLSSRGYRVSTAENGQQAIEHLEEGPSPDLIILDVMMPGLDGYETINRLRTKGYADVPVIFLTAMKEDRDILKGYQSGADYYIAKPFSLEALLNVVEYLVGDLSEEERLELEKKL